MTVIVIIVIALVALFLVIGAFKSVNSIGPTEVGLVIKRFSLRKLPERATPRYASFVMSFDAALSDHRVLPFEVGTPASVSAAATIDHDRPTPRSRKASRIAGAWPFGWSRPSSSRW